MAVAVLFSAVRGKQPLQRLFHLASEGVLTSQVDRRPEGARNHVAQRSEVDRARVDAAKLV